MSPEELSGSENEGDEANKPLIKQNNIKKSDLKDKSLSSDKSTENNPRREVDKTNAEGDDWKNANFNDKIVPENIVEKVLNENRTSLDLGRSTERKNTDILDSAEVTDLEWAKRCLKKGSSPEATCRENKLSVCHIAAFFGDEGIIREVLNKKQEMYNRADALGRTPLHFAAWKGNVSCMEAILGLKEGVLMFEKSSNNKDPETVKLNPCRRSVLNSRKGESTTENNKLYCDSTHTCSYISKSSDEVWKGCTPLHIACARVQLEFVMGLLACGADISTLDEQGRTPLDVCGLAVKQADKIVENSNKRLSKVIEGIIKYGKYRKIDRKSWLTNKNTFPLHTAVFLDSKKATRLLLDIGAVPDYQDKDGQTPFHLAIKTKSTSILKSLANCTYIKLKKCVDFFNFENETPLQCAIKQQWLEGVSILLEANASIIEMSQITGDTSLHLAAEVGNLEIAEKLLKKVPDKQKWIDFRNFKGETPLFKAILRGHASCVRCFLHEGATYLDFKLGNQTVLHMSVEAETVDALNALLEAEDITEILNKSYDEKKFTPLHWAAYNNKAQFVEILLNRGADMTIVSANGSTALHIAAIEGNTDVIKTLLEYDSKNILLMTKDNEGWQPFHRAAHKCKRENIELFLKKGCNLAEDIPSENGQTTLVITKIKRFMLRSAEYFNHLFDERMMTNMPNLDDEKCEVTFDYCIMLPKGKKDFLQMSAIEALLNSKSSSEIKQLILHPYIETFLHFKWKNLKRFFNWFLGIYLMFVTFLTSTTVVLFEKSYEGSSAAWILKTFLLISILIIFTLESMFMFLKKRKYFYGLEGYVKPLSLIMAFILIIFESFDFADTSIRLVAAASILLSWIEITILLSRFPEFGYYFQMFSTVALRAIKVFALFGWFVIIGFALVFWILIRNNESFVDPWSSLMKTVVMMTSEFEYASIIDSSDTKDKIDNIIIQLIFAVFLICVPIVLMNLLLALAVSDVKDLETEGKIQRLLDQVDFLGDLEELSCNRFIKRFISFFGNIVNVEKEIRVYPGRPVWDSNNKLPRSLMEAICKNINGRKMIDEREQRIQNIQNRLKESVEITHENEKINYQRHQELLTLLHQQSQDMKNYHLVNQKSSDARANWAKIFDLQKKKSLSNNN